MKRLPFKILTLSLSTMLAGAVIGMSDDDAVTLNQIASHREWTKMNPEPVKVDPAAQPNLIYAVGGWAVAGPAVSVDTAAARVTSPTGTLLEGLPKAVTNGPNTRIDFPRPGTMTAPPPTSDNHKVTHETSFGLAYINEMGKPALGHEPAIFPVGTIMVREKLLTLDGAPERMVVMIKHEREFNPKVNGW